MNGFNRLAIVRLFNEQCSYYEVHAESQLDHGHQFLLKEAEEKSVRPSMSLIAYWMLAILQACKATFEEKLDAGGLLSAGLRKAAFE